MKKNGKSNDKLFKVIWGELKKINWSEINTQSLKKISVALIGDDKFINELNSLLRKNYGTISIIDNLYTTFEIKQLYDDDFVKSRLSLININDIDNKLTLIKSMDLCIVQYNLYESIQTHNMNTYYYDGNIDTFVNDIIENNNDILPALSYCFPLFRIKSVNKAICLVALQNLSWAVSTCLPNTIPGGHQAITIPIETISDFFVLTANEVKLMFEIVGLSGVKVNPINCFVEGGILFSLAVAAQQSASFILGKIPAGAGLVAKGTIAYAFTFAIGEAILFYQLTGKQIDMDQFKTGFTKIYNNSSQFVKEYIDNFNKK